MENSITSVRSNRKNKSGSIENCDECYCDLRHRSNSEVAVV